MAQKAKKEMSAAQKAKQVITNNVLGLLKQAALAGCDVRDASLKLGDKRKGAYSLYVEAAHTAKTAEVLEMASESLFKMIRETGKIDGKNIGCKASKDGATYIVPSAISSAKSVMTKALVAGLELTDDSGDPRSFSDIRKEVQAIAQKEREADLKGIDLIRVRGRRILAELSDLVAREENAADLTDLLDRTDMAMKDYGFISSQDAAQAPAAPAPEGNTADDVTALVDAADVAAAVAAVQAVRQTRAQRKAN